MSLLRLIARLDVKGPNVVKPVHLEGLRVVGKPEDLALRYANGGADELLYMDVVASLYGRNALAALIERATREVFIPITVGGGIGSVAEVQRLLDAGADKVAINTAAIRDPKLISDIAGRYGSQAISVSIEAKRTGSGWEAYTDCGREKSGLDALVWARQAVESGAGEILLTSIDQEGTQKGFDLALARALKDLPVPVVACGGMGKPEHLREVIEAGADAVAMASVLCFGKHTIGELRDGLDQGKFRYQGQAADRGAFA